MNSTTVAPYFHLDALDVPCPECHADPGVDCYIDWTGRPFTLNGSHAVRHDAADLHEVTDWRRVPDSDVWVGVCADCGEEVDR